MNRTVLIEGTFLFIISIVSIVEGIRLVIYKDPNTLFDPIGPGLYVLIISILLMVTSFTYFIGNYKKNIDTKKDATNNEMVQRVIYMTAAFAAYIFLIYFIGYLLASIIFFLLEFRIVGIKSWPISILLALSFSAFYYVTFVYFCDMVFPRGIINLPIWG
ncbi:hypothetical protein D4S03_04930 [bacterium]|nr:MAG: hypothetical protein D4S03_04930 [bacterium]